MLPLGGQTLPVTQSRDSLQGDPRAPSPTAQSQTVPSVEREGAIVVTRQVSTFPQGVFDQSVMSAGLHAFNARSQYRWVAPRARGMQYESAQSPSPVHGL